MTSLESEDTVAVLRKKGDRVRVGVVSEVFEYEDSESSDSDDDEQENDKLVPGQVRIEWHPTGRETVTAQEKLVLLDRTMLMGELACRQSDTSRVGFVRRVMAVADLKLLPEGRFVVKDVDLSRLRFLKQYDTSSQCLVLYDAMICEVMDVHSKLRLHSPKGYRCTLSVNDSSEVFDSSVRGLVQESSFDTNQWYVGQSVEVRYESLRAPDCEWFGKERPPFRIMRRINAKSTKYDDHVMKFTIEKMDRQSLTVRPIHAFKEHTLEQFNIQATDLNKVVRLDQFEHQTAQVGERMIGVLEANHNIVSLSSWETDWKRKLKESDFNKVPPAVQQLIEQKHDAAPKGDCVCTSTGPLISARSDVSSEQYFTASDTSLNGSQVSLSSAESVDNALPKFMVKYYRRTKKLALKVKSGRRRYGRTSGASVVRVAQPKKKSVKEQPSLGIEFVAEILVQRSYVDVMWQDGCVELCVPTTELKFADHDLDQHVFVVGSFVKHSSLEDSDHSFGIVRRVEAEDRIAVVEWHGEDGVRSTGECSVLDLDNHDQFSFIQTGILVLKLATDDDDNPDFATKVGTVLEVDPSTAGVSVAWCNGVVSQVPPSSIVQAILDEDRNDESEQSSDSETDEGARGSDLSANGVAEQLLNCTRKVEHTLAELNRHLSAVSPRTRVDGRAWRQMKQAVAESLRAMMDNLEGSEYMPIDAALETELSETLNSILKDKEVSHNEAAFKAFTDRFVSVMQRWNDAVKSRISQLETDQGVDGTEASATAEPEVGEDALAVEDEKLIMGAGSFEMVAEVPTEHTYFGEQFLPGAVGRHFMKAVKEELKLLNQSLPSGILVKAFENRLDLFSCLVVGPNGTPYESGLFHLDVRLPPDYPTQPPSVHYISYASEQLNPNLYQDGKVCVSLLGTWSGRSSERWNPGSSLLQVFVSVQGLILNAQPYFNEAGFEPKRALPESREKSRRYNEMALIRSLENLCSMIARPPSAFSEQILDHASISGFKLVSLVESWLDGSVKCEFPLLPISKGCQLSVERQVQKLKQLLNDLETKSP